jgi:hypothetical protein
MKKLIQFITIIVVLILSDGCVSVKKGLVQKGGIDNAIQNAILDFSNTAKLYKKNNVFSVSVLEVANEDLMVVRIGKNSMKLLLTAKAKVGSLDSKLPTRFIEKEGKLFFWWDNEYPLTKEALDVYEKYNLLQDDEGGVITVPEFTVNDAQKAAHYYFCKDDLTKYKKVITNKGVGYYEPPKLNCD